MDVLRTAHEFTLEGFAFPYGDVALLNSNWWWRNAPYVVAQNTGAFLEIPSLLDEQHTVNQLRCRGLPRALEAYAGQIDGETARLKSAAAQNVIAPNFLLDKTLAQLRVARGGKVADWPLVMSLAGRTTSMGGDYAARAAKIAAERIAPALDRQIAELAGASPPRHQRRRRVETAARRRVLRVGAARGHHHAHDAGRDPRRAASEELRELQSRDGRHPAASRA